MWKEKLQDAVTSHPWLEPHQDIKRKPQAPGMQLVDWYGFSVPKTEKKMFLKQSARREDLLVVGEVDNIHSFFSDYETEWRSNILFDDLDEALRYCEDVRSGFISDIQLHSSFIMYKEPGFKAMPGGGFAGWSDLFYAAHGNLEYANKLLFDCQAGDRDGMDPRRCAREDLIKIEVNFYNHESKEARTIPVNPFAASKANKAAREAFFERKDAEREQGKSLGAKAASARGASEKLDGQSQAAPAKDNLEH